MKPSWITLTLLCVCTGCQTPAEYRQHQEAAAHPEIPRAAYNAPNFTRDALKTIAELEWELERRSQWHPKRKQVRQLRRWLPFDLISKWGRALHAIQVKAGNLCSNGMTVQWSMRSSKGVYTEEDCTYFACVLSLIHI